METVKEMNKMWRHRRYWKFHFGFPPFGFFMYSPRPFPSRQEYLHMLEEYKRDLEEELKEIEKEIEEVKQGS